LGPVGAELKSIVEPLKDYSLQHRQF